MGQNLPLVFPMKGFITPQNWLISPSLISLCPSLLGRLESFEIFRGDIWTSPYTFSDGVPTVLPSGNPPSAFPQYRPNGHFLGCSRKRVRRPNVSMLHPLSGMAEQSAPQLIYDRDQLGSGLGYSTKFVRSIPPGDSRVPLDHDKRDDCTAGRLSFFT